MNPLPIIPPRPFLDVPTLLETSRPQRSTGWFWYVLGFCGLMTVLVSTKSSEDPVQQEAVKITTTTVLVGLLVASTIRSVILMRRFRAQESLVDHVEEMVQLRRWEPAGMTLDRFLSEPVHSRQTWGRSLALLSAILSRYHRYPDAMKVHEFLIDHEMLDDATDYSVRVGRAMAMLHEDQLIDADRAIGDLRKRLPGAKSAGLTLVELYRDVKTGHPDEAIEIFQSRREMLRTQLGHRIADAYLMAAAAYDRLGRTDDARTAFERATLLAPAMELFRRYPDLQVLAKKFRPSPAPVEAA
jgi:tetratricopeptide (TPR) repeat protein